MKYLKAGGHSDFFNLGNSEGTTVFEVIEAVKGQTGKEFKVDNIERRPGDPATLVGSSEKARSVLGWIPKYPDIDTIVKHAWNWYLKSKDMREGICHE